MCHCVQKGIRCWRDSLWLVISFSVVRWQTGTENLSSSPVLFPASDREILFSVDFSADLISEYSSSDRIFPDRKCQLIRAEVCQYLGWSSSDLDTWSNLTCLSLYLPTLVSQFWNLSPSDAADQYTLKQLHWNREKWLLWVKQFLPGRENYSNLVLNRQSRCPFCFWGECFQVVSVFKLFCLQNNSRGELFCKQLQLMKSSHLPNVLHAKKKHLLHFSAEDDTFLLVPHFFCSLLCYQTDKHANLIHQLSHLLPSSLRKQQINFLIYYQPFFLFNFEIMQYHSLPKKKKKVKVLWNRNSTDQSLN